MVEVSVSDTGIGVPKDEIDTIFEAFRLSGGLTVLITVPMAGQAWALPFQDCLSRCMAAKSG